MRVKSRYDVEFAYSAIDLFKKKYGIQHKNVIELKRELRRYFHQTTDRRIIHDNGIDGYTVLIACPDSVTDEESAEEWFMENEYRDCRTSAYDCTGQMFTPSHKLVNRQGKWYCYHDVRFDV